MKATTPNRNARGLTMPSEPTKAAMKLAKAVADCPAVGLGDHKDDPMWEEAARAIDDAGLRDYIGELQRALQSLDDAERARGYPTAARGHLLTSLRLLGEKPRVQ
jgi:hypothetical protein